MSRLAAKCRRSQRAFTLLELLVVVGVLVFVIAMLFPALTKAQRQARTITCLSNLHQLYMGYAAYLPQNHQTSLRYDPTYAAFWPTVLRQSFPDVKGILLCPEASTPSYTWGSATTAWGPFDPARGSQPSMAFVGAVSSSYGFNGWLYANQDEAVSGIMWPHPQSAYRIPVFAEATWVDGWPLAPDTVAADAPVAARSEEAGLSRFNISRHGQSINASFLDGHAEQVPLDHLRQLNWSISTHSESSPGFSR